LISQSFDTTPSPFVFLAKRALRIFPGLFGCLIVCVLAIGPLVTNLPMSEYLAKPETWLFLLHNAVLDIHYNRLPGVVFWPGNIGGIVNGPLWSLPCEALLYLMLFGLGVCRLLTPPVSLILLDRDPLPANRAGRQQLWQRVVAARLFRRRHVPLSPAPFRAAPVCMALGRAGSARSGAQHSGRTVYRRLRAVRQLSRPLSGAEPP